MTRRLLSLLMSLTLVFSTLLQFHHHDRMGNIFITLSFIGDVELGFHNHHHSNCCHHPHQGTAPGDCGDNGDCAMHLDDIVTVSSDDTCPYISAAVFNNQAEEIERSLTAPLSLGTESGFVWFVTKLIKHHFLKHSYRRGPPVSAY